MNTAQATSNVQSYVCDDYAYTYRGRGQGKDATVALHINRAKFEAFMNAYWPRYTAERTRDPKSLFHNLLLTHKGFGWIRIECLHEAAEPRLRRFVYYLNCYFRAQRMATYQAERQARLHAVAKENTMVRRYAVTVAASFRSQTIVPPAVKAIRAEALDVIIAAPVPSVDPAKLQSLVAKFAAQATRNQRH